MCGGKRELNCKSRMTIARAMIEWERANKYSSREMKRIDLALLDIHENDIKLWEAINRLLCLDRLDELDAKEVGIPF